MADCVVILGAGAPNGIGGALARRFARERLHAFVSGRTSEKIEASAEAVRAAGGSAEAIVADVRSEEDQDRVFAAAQARGAIAATLYNAGGNAVIPFEELSPSQFEQFWRVGCYGAFLAAKRALPIMAAQETTERGRGSLIFTGASGSLRGKARFAHFAVMKGALRNLAQSLAREYGPKGVHVAHVIIDGAVNGDRQQRRSPERLAALGEDGALDPEAVADAFWAIHAQHRSAWTHEMDLRPFKESW